MTLIKATKRGFAFAWLVVLAGCAASGQTRLADGSVAYRIDCEGTAAGLNYCLGKAGKSCGAEGYTVIDENGQPIATSDVTDAGTDALIRLYATDQNSILIKCGM